LKNLASHSPINGGNQLTMVWYKEKGFGLSLFL
jgi:hypothetical protein